MTAKVTTLSIKPGIQRDGTQFAADGYVDGEWVRFQRGMPRKIGGYNGIFLNGSGISRGMTMTSTGGLNYVVSGYWAGVEGWSTDNDDGVGFGPTPYTISSGFTANDNNLWQFDVGYDSYGAGASKLIAHPGQNLVAIDSTINTRPLVGPFPGSALAPVGIFTAAGTTNTTTTFTLTTANAAVGAGLSITGTGIPSGTTVVSVVGTAVTMSAAATGSASITATFDNNISVSGGIVMLHPYLFAYGNDGLIQNCAAGDFNNWTSSDSNANNVASGKIVKGLPIRGGTTSPSGLFWSLDSVIRVSYSPSTVNGLNFYWRYDLLTSQTSIMSSSSVIEYDGIFYWCGVDRFLSYNGVVQEIPNTQNQNYFFDNLNYAQRQKVWVSKIPRFGEIWWFYPKGDATECTDAIIYNTREKVWYDAGQALGARRSAGAFSEVFRNPIWSGNEINSQGKYTIWQHEKGVNQIYLTNVNAIRSTFETCNLGLVTGGPGNPQLVGDNLWARIDRVEPDFVQEGEMTVTVTGKGYANDEDIVSDPYPFDSTTLKIDMREQRRELRLKFESNTENGNYQMGKLLISVEGGDVRSTGNP